jgi:hypothetical protein
MQNKTRKNLLHQLRSEQKKLNLKHMLSSFKLFLKRNYSDQLEGEEHKIFSAPRPKTGVFKFRAHKGHIKGLKSIRVPKLTRQLLHKPQHCQSPFNRNINMPIKRHLAVHCYSQVIDRVNTIKDDTTRHVRKFNKTTQSCL